MSSRLSHLKNLMDNQFEIYKQLAFNLKVGAIVNLGYQMSQIQICLNLKLG